MKQIEYFSPKKTYIDNLITEILSKYPDWKENKIMSDLVNNLIWDEYWYISARIDINKLKIDKSLIEEIYNFQEYNEKVDQIIKIYEEINNNQLMVKKILEKADWKPSIIKKEDLFKFYNEIKNAKYSKN